MTKPWNVVARFVASRTSYCIALIVEIRKGIYFMNSVENEKNETGMNVETTRTGKRIRSSASALVRIAFWSALIRFVLSQGGLITLLVKSGGTGLATSQDVFSIVVGSLISVIALATRKRWGTVVSTIAAAYVFYLTITDHYELFDLANPKGPNGGLIIFTVDVLALALAILTLGGSIGAMIESFRQDQRKAPSWLAPVGLYAVVGLVIGALYIGAIR